MVWIWKKMVCLRSWIAPDPIWQRLPSPKRDSRWSSTVEFLGFLCLQIILIFPTPSSTLISELPSHPSSLLYALHLHPPIYLSHKEFSIPKHLLSLSPSLSLSLCLSLSPVLYPMGLALNQPLPPTATRPHRRAHHAFLLSSYVLLGAASACVFLTLSLRLLPSLSGLLFILLHLFTIFAAVAGCLAASNTSLPELYGAHMAATVMAAILQGAAALMVFTKTEGVLEGLKSYVREEDGEVIIKMVGGLGVVIFCVEWVVLALAFVLRYYESVEENGGARRSAKAQQQELGGWPWPFQV